MFIKNCMQTFIMDEKEVVIFLHVLGYGRYIDFYAIPVEVADELNLDEFDGMDTESDEEELETLLYKIKEFKIEREHGKKTPYAKIHKWDY